MLCFFITKCFNYFETRPAVTNYHNATIEEEFIAYNFIRSTFLNSVDINSTILQTTARFTYRELVKSFQEDERRYLTNWLGQCPLRDVAEGDH